jgi:hypothetical protein
MLSSHDAMNYQSLLAQHKTPQSSLEEIFLQFTSFALTTDDMTAQNQISLWLEFQMFLGHIEAAIEQQSDILIVYQPPKSIAQCLVYSFKKGMGPALVLATKTWDLPFCPGHALGIFHNYLTKFFHEDSAKGQIIKNRKFITEHYLIEEEAEIIFTLKKHL